MYNGTLYKVQLWTIPVPQPKTAIFHKLLNNLFFIPQNSGNVYIPWCPIFAHQSTAMYR